MRSKPFRFQWFVAWRYLLERPGYLAGTILIAVALSTGLALGSAVALAWYPLSEPLYVAPPTLPPWLPAALGMLLGAAIVSTLSAPFFAVVSRGPRVLHWQRLSKPAAWSGRALAMGCYFSALSLALILFADWLRRQDPFGESGELVADGVFLSHPLWIGAAALLVVAGGLYLASARSRLSRPLGALPKLLLFALACAAIGLSGRSFAAGLVAIRENLEFLGGLGVVKSPMWLIITGLISAAIAALALLLLIIRYFFTFFTTVSIGGVAIGTMALVIVLSVMSGFESDLREKILGSNAHILVTQADEAQFADYRRAAVDDRHGPRRRRPQPLSPQRSRRRCQQQLRERHHQGSRPADGRLGDGARRQRGRRSRIGCPLAAQR